MSSFSLYGIVLILGLALGGWGGHKATQLHYQHEIDLDKRKAQQQVDQANQRAENAATDWQAWAEVQRPKTVTITREVEREVSNDTECSARPLPAGLRDALTAAAAAGDDQRSPDSSMPAAPAARPEDLGRPGPGLRRDPG